jgi:ATP-dependent 26S proteasome regulatory subunit
MPDGVLEKIERLTVDFSARAAAMRAGGRHLRRGLLLHGSPGTGKTHTVRYLMSRLADRTVFVLSGAGLGVIGKTVALARQLRPSIVVLEDVDLVAEERTRPHAGTNPVLFELLNQMDGVEEDADIVFILTTNRPDLLEPALASRPGRVDLAIEIPLPAAHERERLLALYAQGLDVQVDDWGAIVDGTEGSSAAFLRELIRQAALDAAGTDGARPSVTSAQLVQALASMSHADQAMTARLMGSAQ